MRLVSEFHQRGDLAGIIDHRRLAHFATPSDPRDAQLIRWIHLGLPQQMLKQFRPAKVSRKFGGLQKSLAPGLCRAAQPCRDLQDLDDHGDGASALRAARHEIEFGSQFVVRSHRRRRTMPKPAILILDDRGKRGVNPLARCNVGGLMDRGSYKRVSKPHLHCIEIDQLGGDGGRKGVNSDVPGEQHFAGPQDFVEGCPAVFGSDIHQHPGGAGKVGQTAGEGAFKPLRQWKP